MLQEGANDTENLSSSQKSNSGTHLSDAQGEGGGDRLQCSLDGSSSDQSEQLLGDRAPSAMAKGAGPQPPSQPAEEIVEEAKMPQPAWTTPHGRYVSSAPQHIHAVLKMRCETSGADYALYWKQDGPKLVVRGGYVTPRTLQGLRASGASDTYTYVDACAKVILLAAGSNAVARARREGTTRFIHNAAVHDGFARSALAQAHGIQCICFMPTLDGVLEYGSVQADWDETAAHAAMPVDEITTAFQSRGAFAILWKKEGSDFLVAADYTDVTTLTASADHTSYSSASRAVILPSDDDNLVAAAALSRDGFDLSCPSENPKFKRSALAKKFRVASTRFVPVVGGVLEYGVIDDADRHAAVAESDGGSWASTPSNVDNPSPSEQQQQQQSPPSIPRQSSFRSNPPGIQKQASLNSCRSIDEVSSVVEKICQECEEDDATCSCATCDLILCHACAAGHRKSKHTKTHVLQDLPSIRRTAQDGSWNKEAPRARDRCQECDEGQGMVYCATCDMLFCEDCTEMHKKRKRTRDHTLSLVERLLHTISQLEPPSDGTYVLKGNPSLKEDPYGLLEKSGGAMGDLDGKAAEGLMDITVVKASHLPKMDYWGSCDGLVQLSFQDESLALPNQTMRTECVKNSFNPTFDETFTFQVPRVHQSGELTISLFDWNMTGGEELVGKVTLKSSQITQLLCGQRGKTVKLTLTLQNELGGSVVGHDKQNASIEVRVRPFVRFMGTRAYRDWQASLHPPAGPSDAIGNPRKPRALPARASSGKMACKHLGASVRMAAIKDLCCSSRFVHAQIWRFDRCEHSSV